MKGGIQAEGDGQHASKDLKGLVGQASKKEMDLLEYEDAKQKEVARLVDGVGKWLKGKNVRCILVHD